MKSLKSVDELLALYTTYGNDLYGEDVTQLDHALQCAALAAHRGDPPELIIAALLHDVGHLAELADGVDYEQSTERDHAHDRIGAKLLEDLYPESVTKPIALHVIAKRWRCTVDPGYEQGLSPASVTSLALQGGHLSPQQRAEFEADPYFAVSVALRELDDAGKVTDLEVEDLDAYEGMLRRLVSESTIGRAR